MFVLVVVSPELEVTPAPEASKPPKLRGRRRRSEEASIDLEIDSVLVRVGRDADAGAIAAVIDALKTGA